MTGLSDRPGGLRAEQDGVLLLVELLRGPLPLLLGLSGVDYEDLVPRLGGHRVENLGHEPGEVAVVKNTMTLYGRTPVSRFKKEKRSLVRASGKL